MTTLTCSLAYGGLLPRSSPLVLYLSRRVLPAHATPSFHASPLIVPLAILILGRDIALTLSAFYLRYTTLAPPVRSPISPRSIAVTPPKD